MRSCCGGWIISISPPIRPARRFRAGPTGGRRRASRALIFHFCSRTRSITSARASPSATRSMAGTRSLAPRWARRCAALRTTGSRRNGWRAMRGCAPRSWCRRRTRSFAVSEIERKAGDKRFVQILLPVAAEMMYGQQLLLADLRGGASSYDLPIGLHAGSMYRHAPTANGWPSHYLQDYVAHSQIFEDQLLSLVSEGMFVEVPEAARGADRIRRDLAAALPVARDQDLARRAGRGAVGEALAGRRTSATMSA